MTLTAEEIFSSWIFSLLIVLVAFFLIQPLIQLKELMLVKKPNKGGKKTK